MDIEQLKSKVVEGRYRPKPALIAEAMLRRRSMRELLIEPVETLSPADRIPAVRAGRRQAA